MRIKRLFSLLLAAVIMLSAFSAIGVYAKTGEEFTDYYLSTASQEKDLVKMVNAVASDLKLKSESLSELEKTRRIYNFLCSSTVYDDDMLKDGSYKIKYTAYGTLVNGTSVCAGYAEAFDMLAKAAGLKTHVIKSHNPNKDYHAWNIVKIGNKYYNVDATWDAISLKYGGQYNYFLECNSDFEDCSKPDAHKRHKDYKTDEFNKKYPMSSKSYYGGSAVEIVKCSHKHKKKLYSRKSTCKVSSYGGGKLCKDCGYVFKCGKRGKKGKCLKYWKITKYPTCTRKGRKKYMCAFCNKVYKTKSIPKKHKYKKYTNICEGCTCQKCSYCGKIKSKN